MIIVDSADIIVSPKQSSAPYVNDHDYILCEIDLNMPLKKQKSNKSRSFGKFSPEVYMKAVSRELCKINQPRAWNVDDYLATSRATSIEYLDLYAFFTTRTVRPHPAPWLTVELLDKRKHRDQLYKRKTNRKFCYF